MDVVLCITQAPEGQNTKFIACLSWVRACLFFSAILRFQISYHSVPRHLPATEKRF